MKLKNVKRGRRFIDGANKKLTLMKTRALKTKGENPFNCICLTDDKNVLQGELLYLEPDTEVTTI